MGYGVPVSGVSGSYAAVIRSLFANLGAGACVSAAGSAAPVFRKDLIELRNGEPSAGRAAPMPSVEKTRTMIVRIIRRDFPIDIEIHSE